MRIKMLACLALAVCIFAAPVSAKDKNKTADMFLNGWGTVAVPDSLYYPIRNPTVIDRPGDGK